MRLKENFEELYKIAVGNETAQVNPDDLNGTESGCTATIVLITRDRIYCANAGDSRTIMSEKGATVPLSFDHKPDNEGEKSRIEAAGGTVENGRVDGNLAVSRALGDFELKNNEKVEAKR
jgi:protein phosphatase PTC2/3